MKQQITNFGRFYSLLKLMPGGNSQEDLKRELVWRFTGLRTDSLREIRKDEYDRMIEHMEDVAGNKKPERKKKGYHGDEAEKWRKRAIAAIFGFYEKIKEPKTLNYVKGIICRAGGVTDINQIPPFKMRAIYNDWVGRVKVKQRVDGIVSDELEKHGYN